jgi:hypothetical protein
MIYGGIAHYTTAYGILDRAVGNDLARIAGRNYRLVFAVFPAVDGVAHSYDPWHPKVLQLYRQFDAAIGRYVARGGFAGDHLAVLVSDHGMTRIYRHSDVALALEQRGLRTLRHPLMVSGNASAQVYLRPGIRRTSRWLVSAIEAGEVPGIPADLVQYLTALPGVALVAGVDGPEVVVHSRDGHARLEDRGDGFIRYDPITADVLDLAARTATRTAREWLSESINRSYPDSAVQLLQLFRSPRAGDLAISATIHADLRGAWEVPEHHSGHGGLVKDHMRCLVAMNRPASGPVRTVDVFPLILRHLGHAVPGGIDGVPIEVGSPTTCGVA